jgi:hypothetical protein
MARARQGRARRSRASARASATTLASAERVGELDACRRSRPVRARHPALVMKTNHPRSARLLPA